MKKVAHRFPLLQHQACTEHAVMGNPIHPYHKKTEGIRRKSWNLIQSGHPPVAHLRLMQAKGEKRR